MCNPPHPGEVIREGCLVDGFTVATAAKHLGVSRAVFERVLDGQAPVSPRLARQMQTVGWSTAAFWLRMQAGYDRAREHLLDKRAAAATPPGAAGSATAANWPTQIAHQCLPATDSQAIQRTSPLVRTERSGRASR